MITTAAPKRMTPARENPFRVDRTDRLAFQFSQGNWSGHLLRLAALSYRAAIVGPQGSGKTTLLEELAGHLRTAGRIPVLCRATGDRKGDAALIAKLIDPPYVAQIILLDSAEQLSRIHWRRLLRQTGNRRGLVVTSHRRCALPTWIECRTSWSLMQSLLADLRLPEPDHQMLMIAQRSFQKHHGNIRDVLRELFDLVADGRLAITRSTKKSPDLS